MINFSHYHELVGASKMDLHSSWVLSD